MTRRECSNHWSGGIAGHPPTTSPPPPRPKIFTNAKIRSKICRLDLVASRLHHPHWLSSKEPVCHYGVLLISGDIIEGRFEGEMWLEILQYILVLAWQHPGSPVTCNTAETGLAELPLSLSPSLFSGSGPVWLQPFPWTEENWKVSIFRPTWRSLLPRRTG